MALELTTAPTKTPVSLAEAKGHCRVTDTVFDARILSLIQAATARVERITGARLCAQTVTLTLDKFPSWDLDLGVYPVRSVTSVKHDDTANVEQTLTLDTGGSPQGDYFTNLTGMYPKISPRVAWPATYYKKPASVRIVLEVGYTKLSDIPADLKHAVLVCVKEMFDIGGESVAFDDLTPAMNTVKALTDMHRRMPV